MAWVKTQGRVCASRAVTTGTRDFWGAGARMLRNNSEDRERHTI